ncbi:MAG: hypothetical protein WDO69_22715 [Pseudomonadota bacterium]
MSTPYAGNAASFPTNIALIEDSDEPCGVTFSTPLEQLADRSKALVPDVQVFTANGAWAKPANAKYVEFTLVGAGGDGTGGVGGFGGTAGGAGQIQHALFPASSVPASLTATVGAGVDSHLVDGTGAFLLNATKGGVALSGAGVSGISPGITGANNPVGGGAGGFRGGGSIGGGGLAGKGAGAGGGGGGSGGGIGSSAGGHGGDGGYGYNVAGVTAATDGGNGGASAGAGGSGASGLIVITTFRGA